jgi:hypothetical protein
VKITDLLRFPEQCKVLNLLFIGGESFLLKTEDFSDHLSDEVFFDTLSSDFFLAPNWEAVGARIIGEYRKDRNSLRAYVCGEILARQKRRIKPQISAILKGIFPSVHFEWVEVPYRKLGDLHLVHTFSRNLDGAWEEVSDIPIERAIHARVPVQEVGQPGGPCQVIFNIEDSFLPEHYKEDLIQDVLLGKDLDNSDAAKVYGGDVISLRGRFLKNLHITNHSKYRMDLRSVTLEMVVESLNEFERWFLHKKQNPHSIKGQEERLLADLVSGQPVRFDARNSKVTIIFRASPDGSARLISSWRTGTSDPKTPSSKGECRRAFTTRISMDKELDQILDDLIKVADIFDDEYDEYCCDCEDDEECDYCEYEECECDEDEECDYCEEWEDYWDEYEEDGEDDISVEGAVSKKRKKRRRSDAKSYRQYRKRYKKNRRRINRQRRRKRRNPSVRRRQKRLQLRRKHRPKGRQRSKRS